MSRQEQGQDLSPSKTSPLYWEMHQVSDDCPPMDEPRTSRFSEQTDYERFAKDSIREFLRREVDEMLLSAGEGWPASDLPNGTVIRFVKEQIDFTTDVYRSDLYWGVLGTDPKTGEKLLLYQRVHPKPMERWTVARDPQIVVGAVMHAKQGENNYAERIRELVTYGIRPPRGGLRVKARKFYELFAPKPQLRPVHIRP